MDDAPARLADRAVKLCHHDEFMLLAPAIFCQTRGCFIKRRGIVLSSGSSASPRANGTMQLRRYGPCQPAQHGLTLKRQSNGSMNAAHTRTMKAKYERDGCTKAHPCGLPA